MAQSETKLKIVVDAENQTGRAFQSVSSSLSSMTDTMKSVGKVGAIGFGAVSAALYTAIEAASEAAKIDAQLEAVLKSTGHAAGLFKQDLEDQAVALQRMTTFDDEAVKSVEALLLTFTNVKGAVFKEALPAVLDMSIALGQDLKSSAIQVGKALNDPINGITALRRVGVSFTDAQQEVIAKLVETGQTAEAQRLILKELNTEFGGSAQAQAGTYAGQLAQLKNRFGDLQESIGGLVIPALNAMLAQLAPILERTIAWANENPKLAQSIIFFTLGLTALLAVLFPIAIIIQGLAILFTSLGAAFVFVAAMSAPLVLAIGAIAAILAILVSQGYLTKTAWQDVWLGIKVITADAVNAVTSSVEGMINFIIDGVNGAIKAINKLISVAQKVPGIGKLIPSLGMLDKVNFGSIDTGTIAANDLAGRANPISSQANTVIVTGNTVLSQSVAEQIGDMIMGRLKLSTNL